MLLQHSSDAKEQQRHTGAAVRREKHSPLDYSSAPFVVVSLRRESSSQTCTRFHPSSEYSPPQRQDLNYFLNLIPRINHL